MSIWCAIFCPTVVRISVQCENVAEVDGPIRSRDAWTFLSKSDSVEELMVADITILLKLILSRFIAG